MFIGVARIRLHLADVQSLKDKLSKENAYLEEEIRTERNFGDIVGDSAALRRVLEEGIHRQGASIDWVYRGGDFQNYFQVYQRAGQPCPECSTPILRILVGQRGTHFCPTCQRLEPAAAEKI